MNKGFKKAKVWLYIEYKRAAAMLPKLLKRAAIFIVCIVFITGLAIMSFNTDKNDNNDKMHIGYVAEKSMLINFAISYVENMEFVHNLCVLEAVEEDKGKQLVEEGRLAALVVLPNDIVNEILSGSNTPAVLYLPENTASNKEGFNAVGSMLFEEFVDAAVSMLGTAQAEIYAASAILDEFLHEAVIQDNVLQTGEILQAMYDDINQFNLSMVASREKLFDNKRLSVTENDTYVVYYASAIFTIYLLLSGLFFGEFLKRSRIEQDIAAKRQGINYITQLGSKWLVSVLLVAVAALLPFFVLLILQIKNFIVIEWSLNGTIALLFIIFFIASYSILIYHMVGKHQSALTVIGVMALFQAYLSGCLIPSVLLPRIVSEAGSILPAAYIKAGITMLLGGSTKDIIRILLGLFLWGLLCLVLTWMLMYARENNIRLYHGIILYYDKNLALPCKIYGKWHIPSVFMVMLRRMLYKKITWICMLLVILFSVLIVGTEKKAGAQINAAVYDAEGIYASVLTEHEGLVKFICYASEEEVKKAVLKGDVECGYIIPDDLMGNMIAQQENKLITVYQDADAVTVPLVNEVLFERVFRIVSLEWYHEYMENQDIFINLGIDMSKLNKAVDKAFEQQIEEKATYQFEIAYLNSMDTTDAIEEEKTHTYPVLIVAVVTVLLCVGQGILQIISDVKNRRFYKRNRVAMSVLTIALPLLLGLITGFLTVVIVRFWI